MKFFVPAAADAKEAERVYRGIAEFNTAPLHPRRIYALRWKHNGQSMSCAVGDPLPTYYGPGAGVVLAIFDCGSLFKVCAVNRGGVRGEAVLAGNGWETTATYFDDET